MRIVVLAACVGAACAGGLRDAVLGQITRFCLGACIGGGIRRTIQGVDVCIPEDATVDATSGVVTLDGATIYTPGQVGQKCPVAPKMPTFPAGFTMPTMPELTFPMPTTPDNGLPIPDTGLPITAFPSFQVPIPDTGIPALPQVPIPDTGIPALPPALPATSDCRAPCQAGSASTCASGAFVTNGVCNCVTFFAGTSCAPPGGLPVRISGLPTCPSTCASPAPALPNTRNSPGGAASLGVSLAAAAAAAMLAL
jgi:hypothetical protein